MLDDEDHGDDDGEGHPSDDEWCSINEAARRLRVTPTAIRNRIKRGTLETRPNGNHGRLVRVPKPVAPTVPLTESEPVPDTVSDTVPEPVPDTVTLTVMELRLQVAEMQERLAVAQEDLIALAREAGASQGELGALRSQVDDLRQERDRWAGIAEAHQRHINDLTAERQESAKKRSWWPWRRTG